MNYLRLNLLKVISYPIFVGYDALFELIKCKLVTTDKAEIYAMCVYRIVMGKFKKRYSGMTQTREPPTFDTSLKFL